MADEKKMPEYVTIEDRNGERQFARIHYAEKVYVVVQLANGVRAQINRQSGHLENAPGSMHQLGWRVIGEDLPKIARDDADTPKQRTADVLQALARPLYVGICNEKGAAETVMVVGVGDKILVAKDFDGREMPFRRSDGMYAGLDDRRRADGWRIGDASMAAVLEQCARQQAGVDRVTQTATVDVSAEVAARIDDLKREVDAAIAEAKEASGSAAVVFADAFYTAIDRGTTTMASASAVIDAGNTAATIVDELRKHNALHAAAEMAVARLGLASDNMAAWRAQRDAGDAEPIYNITLIANSAEGGKAAAEAFVRRIHEWQERRSAG